MTRILVQRGSSSSNQSRSSSTRAESSASVPPAPLTVKDEESVQEVPEVVVDNEPLDSSGSGDGKTKNEEHLVGDLHCEQNDTPKGEIDDVEKAVEDEAVGGGECDNRLKISDNEGSSGSGDSFRGAKGFPIPSPPPVPPPSLPAPNLNSKRNASSNLNTVQIGPSPRAAAWPVVSARTSPAGSRPTSPKSLNENEGYNSADEQSPCFPSSYNDLVSSYLIKSY